jgi:hypothetical protein
VTVARTKKESKPGTGSAFAKTGFKRLRQEEHTWEADFRALPKPMTQSETHYLGMVVMKEGGSVLAQTQVEGRPDASDLAALLAQAMRQPLTGRPTGLAACTSGDTTSGGSYSRTWKNSASTFRFTGNSRR